MSFAKKIWLVPANWLKSRAKSAAAIWVARSRPIVFLTLSPSHPKNMAPSASAVMNVTRTMVNEYVVGPTTNPRSLIQMTS